VWRNKAIGRRCSSVLLALALTACSMADATRTPAPPAGAERVADWSAFDQARADQLRRGLTELDRRFPAGEAIETQLWRLPASMSWPALRLHYDQQPGWQTDPQRQASAGPLVPDAQVYVDAAGGAMLTVAYFGTASDAVLVVQRARAVR
jgi:hypothetical protein